MGDNDWAASRQDHSHPRRRLATTASVDCRKPGCRNSNTHHTLRCFKTTHGNAPHAGGPGVHTWQPPSWGTALPNNQPCSWGTPHTLPSSTPHPPKQHTCWGPRQARTAATRLGKPARALVNASPCPAALATCIEGKRCGGVRGLGDLGAAQPSPPRLHQPNRPNLQIVLFEDFEGRVEATGTWPPTLSAVTVALEPPIPPPPHHASRNHTTRPTL